MNRLGAVVAVAESENPNGLVTAPTSVSAERLHGARPCTHTTAQNEAIWTNIRYLAWRSTTHQYRYALIKPSHRRYAS